MGVDYFNNLTIINENEENDIIEKIYNLLKGYDTFKIDIHKKNKLYLVLTVESSKSSICDLVEDFYYVNKNFWFINKYKTDYNFCGLCTGGILQQKFINIKKLEYETPDIQFIDYVENLT